MKKPDNTWTLGQAEPGTCLCLFASADHLNNPLSPSLQCLLHERPATPVLCRCYSVPARSRTPGDGPIGQPLPARPASQRLKDHMQRRRHTAEGESSPRQQQGPKQAARMPRGGSVQWEATHVPSAAQNVSINVYKLCRFVSHSVQVRVLRAFSPLILYESFVG